MSQRTGFSSLQITLHWLVAILILAAWLTAEWAEGAQGSKVETGAGWLEGNTLHDWLGGVVFALILVRLILRRVQGSPDPVPGTSAIMHKATIWGHRLLYILMFAASVFGVATWYSGIAGELHETAANALMIVALGHALIAIWHQFVLKDGALTRMWRPRG